MYIGFVSIPIDDGEILRRSVECAARRQTNDRQQSTRVERVELFAFSGACSLVALTWSRRHHHRCHLADRQALPRLRRRGRASSTPPSSPAVGLPPRAIVA